LAGAWVVVVEETGYHGRERIIGRNDRTTWCRRSTPTQVPAELVRAARAAAERLNPGWWQIEADD